MTKTTTFADHWWNNNSDIFQLLISEAINESFKEESAPFIINRVKLSDTKDMYYIGDIPVLGSEYDPIKAKHIYYAKDYNSPASSRGSKNITSRLSRITAKHSQ